MAAAADLMGLDMTLTLSKVEDVMGDSKIEEKVTGVISGAVGNEAEMATSAKALLLLKQSAVVNSESM